MAATDQLCHAAELIELARGEETEDGNPLTAVRHYTTAMEIIASEASRCAALISNDDARRFFLFQARAKMEVYYERTALLLQVANESGLLDKPSSKNGSPTHILTDYPPALFTAPVTSGEKNCAGGAASHGNGGGGSVLGIPLFSRGSAASTQPGVDHDNAKESSMNSYLKPALEDAIPTPPVTPGIDLDEFLKSLGAPPDS
ncbi:hypothetical protein JKF63_07023 [Porcisia hertigi]|uniref:Uncharacterized protein n=1 Tax=Porcisia hertigi TaxID=2761500 RepID=A0A836LGK5_9TRYP|nr:hypothetical protein JKF63_07023 [Porcisia hertigi]